MSASPPFGRTILALGLCLLAFSFAMEAKLAWYGPQVGIGSDMSAAKALPADVPDVVRHGVPAPDPIHPLVPFLLLPIFAASILADAHLRLRPAHHPPSFSAASYFSPKNFFRPPPAY